MSSSIELSNSEIVKAFPPTVIYIIENKDIFYVGMRTLDYKLDIFALLRKRVTQREKKAENFFFPRTARSF